MKTLRWVLIAGGGLVVVAIATLLLIPLFVSMDRIQGPSRSAGIERRRPPFRH